MPQRLDEFLGSDSAAPAQGPMRLDQYVGSSQQMPTGMSTQERANADFQLAHPIAPAAPAAQPQQMGAVRNAATAAFHSVGDALGNAGVRAAGFYGLIRPETAQAGMQNQLFHPEEDRLSATIGSGLGQAALMATGSAAPLAFAIEGAEAAKEREEQRMANGEQISALRQLGDVGGQAALSYAFGKLAPGSKVSKALLGKLPGGVVGRMLGAGAVGAGENVAQTVGGNVIANKVGGETDRPFTAGVGDAALGGAVFGAGGQAIHEAPGLLKRMRDKQSAAAAPATKAPVPNLDEKLNDHTSPVEAAPQKDGRVSDQPTDQSAASPVHNPDDRQPGNPAEQTSGEKRVMESFGRRADAEPQIPPTPGEKNVLDAHMRSVDREGQPEDTSNKMRQPERMRDSHPERLSGGKDMTDYVARISDDAATAPLIGSMTESHGNFVRARVPIDQLHGLGDTGADVVASKGGEQKNPAVSIPSGTGEEGHLDLIDGNHSVEGLRQAGATHAESYVPESMIGKHGIEAVTAQKPAAVPQPIVEQKTPLRQMMARRQGAPRAGAIAIPESKYVERDVQPALAKATDALKKSMATVNRTLGTGASWSVKDRDSANHVSAALAEHDRALAQAEHELKPHREAMEKWTPDAKAQWIDAVEGSGISPDPAHQDAADFNLKYNQENIDRGKLVGINTKNWSGDYIGRLAEFPDEHEGSGGTGRTTLAGPQNFLKGRVFDTFSEFKKFVEDNDGKLKYSNPMDMLLAKQGEIQKAIVAREAMYKEDNHGQLKWVPDGEKPPEGFEKGKLADPLASQERRQILPSSTVARLAGMSHFDAQNFLKGPQVEQQAQYLRPGTDVPAGYSYSGEKVTGTYHGNENVAGIFNNLVSPGLKKNVPVLHQIAAGVKGATSLSLNLSGAHYMIETLNNAGQSIGRAIRAATEGDAQGVRDNLKMVNPLAANRLGKQAREQYANPGAHPQLESKVQTSVEGGAPFSRSSVLDKNYLADAKTEWAAGNKIGAGVRVAKHLYDNIPIHHYLFKEFVPNLKAAAAVMTAGQAEAKGLTGEAKQRFMALAHDDIENNLGMVARNRQFQNRVISDAMDIVMLAPKYVEGRIRNTAAAGRDSLAALRDVSSGKRPVLTPAMATAAGHMVAHAMIATLTQIAYTTATTGKPILPSGPMDLLKPRTGRKDDQGREERLTMPTPISTIFGLLSRGTGALTSRVAPVWHTIANEMANVDEHNVEIRHRGDSLGKQLADSAKYAVKGQAPFAIQNVMEAERPGQPHGVAKNVGEALGVHTSYRAASGAEQEARSALFERGRANPMTQEQYARQQERGRVLEEMKNKNPDAPKDLAADLRSGALTQSDRLSLAKQRKAPEGLGGVLKKMQAEEIMDRVWPKMTADEKQKNQWLVRGMIGRSQTLTPPQKKELWGKIKQETTGVK